MVNKIDNKKEKTNDDKSNSVDIIKTSSDKKMDLPVNREKSSLFQIFNNYIDEMRRDFFNTWIDFSPKAFLSKEMGNEYRTPLTNIEQNKKEYVVNAELPGITKDQISVFLGDNLLEIVAENTEDTTEEDEGKYVRKEFHSYNFYRSFSIPENVDQSKITIKFDKGILKIKLPKIETKEKSKIKLDVN